MRLSEWTGGEVFLTFTVVSWPQTISGAELMTAPLMLFENSRPGGESIYVVTACNENRPRKPKLSAIGN